MPSLPTLLLYAGVLVVVGLLLVDWFGLWGSVLRKIPERVSRARQQRNRPQGLVIPLPQEVAFLVDNEVLQVGQILWVEYGECRVDTGGHVIRFAAPRSLEEGRRFRIGEIGNAGLTLEEVESGGSAAAADFSGGGEGEAVD